MNKEKGRINSGEQGQSMVLIAFVLIGLLAFVGLAIDTGFWMARTAKLQAVVDSAALAGVTELSNGTKVDADNVAVRFMHANGAAGITGTVSITSTVNSTILGAREYALTSTWDVELFFLPLIGIDSARVTRSATASYFPITDIAIGERTDDGAVATSYQAINGINLAGDGRCTLMGDPFSPKKSVFRSRYSPYSWNGDEFTYRYRIMIPADYKYDYVRVEILDPDSWSEQLAPEFESNYTYSGVVQKLREEDGESNIASGTNTADVRSGSVFDVAAVATGEDAYVGEEYEGREVTTEDINPWWFLRLDAHYHTDCGDLPASYDFSQNNITKFELSYIRRNSDNNTNELIDLVSYTGQQGGDLHTPPTHDTNLRWVSPGSDRNEGDQPVAVPVDAGSMLTSFTVDISDDSTDVPGILVESGSGIRYLYFGVTSIGGQSQNGFDLWAGPPIYFDKNGNDLLDADDVPSNINERNLYLVEHRGGHTAEGLEIYAMGQLPMKSLADNPANIPLVYIGPQYTGNIVEVTLFDADQYTYAPIIFYFDTIAFQPDTSCSPEEGFDGYCDGVDWDMTDWAMSFGNNDIRDPDGEFANERCRFYGGSGRTDCASVWVDPPYRIEVPGEPEGCNIFALPPNGIRNVEADHPKCIPFYGGRLTAYYRAGQNDVYGWNIEMPGIPSLIR